MTLQTHFQLHASGLQLVAQAAGVSKAAMIAWGATPDEADQMLRLYSAYFGKTSYPGLQRKARESKHGLGDLLRIEKFVARVERKHALKAAKLRAKLAKTPAASINQVARKFIAELTPKKKPAFGVTNRRYDGYQRITLTADDLLGTEFWHFLGGPDGATPESISRLIHNNSNATSADAASSDANSTQLVLNLVVPVDENLQPIGESVNGGEEVLFRTIEGATLTGAQILNAKFADYGHILAIHPVHGKINLYRTKRMANFKQRFAAALMNPTCCWEGCRKPASESQVNHVVPYKNGGFTNMNNLVTACAYHNGINDDDRLGFLRDGSPTHGFMDICAGVGVRVPFPGAPPRFNATAFRWPSHLRAGAPPPG